MKRQHNNTNVRGLKLQEVNLDIAKEWDVVKNQELGYKVEDITNGSRKKVWWICPKGHSYNMPVYARTHQKCNCPYCSNKRILIGFNDMWTTNHSLASKLLNSDEGYNHTEGSKKRVDWKCPSCENIIRNKSICNIKRFGLHCTKCADGVSFGEKFVYNLLCSLDLEFEKERTFKWLPNKRYDFYLPKHNMVIEVHGKQHIDDKLDFSNLGGRTSEEEKENDTLKQRFALSNGIESYVVINSSDMLLDSLKREIENSLIASFFDLSNISWEKIYLDSSKSLLVSVCDTWNKGEHQVSHIAKKFGISKVCVADYLRKGKSAGICDYDIKESLKYSGLKDKKGVIQLNLENEFIKKWDSIADIKRYFNKKSGCDISYCCNGKRKTAFGFKWIYEEEYNKQER